MDFGFVKTYVDEIVARFGTSDVFAIAEGANVRIVYSRWFPVTIGEFDRKTRTICVNLNANEEVEKIIAHELGHLFAVDLNLSRTEEEEVFARRFAEELFEKNG